MQMEVAPHRMAACSQHEALGSFVGVVQLAEQRPSKSFVVGSRPTIHYVVLAEWPNAPACGAGRVIPSSRIQIPHTTYFLKEVS